METPARDGLPRLGSPVSKPVGTSRIGPWGVQGAFELPAPGLSVRGPGRLTSRVRRLTGPSGAQSRYLGGWYRYREREGFRSMGTLARESRGDGPSPRPSLTIPGSQGRARSYSPVALMGTRPGTGGLDDPKAFAVELVSREGYRGSGMEPSSTPTSGCCAPVSPAPRGTSSREGHRASALVPGTSGDGASMDGTPPYREGGSDISPPGAP